MTRETSPDDTDNSSPESDESTVGYVGGSLQEYDSETDYQVGDVAMVRAADPEEDYASDFHEIRLKDPKGRMGLVWHCQRCGAWYASVLNFETRECIVEVR